MHLVAYHSNMTCLRVLLLHNSPVDGSRDDGHSPLHLACGRGQEEMISDLIFMGANVSLRNSSNMTPLHTACWNKQPQSVLALIRSFAPLEAKSQNGRSVRLYASVCRSVIIFLQWNLKSLSQ